MLSGRYGLATSSWTLNGPAMSFMGCASYADVLMIAETSTGRAEAMRDLPCILTVAKRSCDNGELDPNGAE